MNKLLLHSCCAPCLTSSHEQLMSRFEITPFWYNPNIEPNAEYRKRLDNFERYCELIKVAPIIENGYAKENEVWKKLSLGLENEPEGGQRCEKCIRLRLQKTALCAKASKFRYFSTTLTVSPHKNARMINAIGCELAAQNGLVYVETDLKKNDGYKRSIELSAQIGLYRQNYCGCACSIRNK